MENKNVKLGLNPALICGWILMPFGCFFIVLGLSLGFALKLLPLLAIFCGGGALFLLIGIFLMGYSSCRKNRLQKLVDSGKFLWAEVTDVEPDHTVCINGRCGNHLIVRYRDPQGNIHLFKSRNFALPHVPDFMGQQVKVYVDPDNFKYYYVDAEPLLSSVIEH